MNLRFSEMAKLLPFALVALVCMAAPQTPARAANYGEALSCGNLDLDAASSEDAAKAFDCFATAYSHCQTATLVATSSDAGMPTTWTFTTTYGNDYGGSNLGCNVSETIERGGGSSKTTDASICRNVIRDKGSLRFTGCANSKDVTLRLASPR